MHRMISQRLSRLLTSSSPVCPMARRLTAWGFWRQDLTCPGQGPCLMARRLTAWGFGGSWRAGSPKLLTHVGSAVSLLILLLVCPARAESVAGADVLFEAGRQALQRGDYDEACLKFRESQRLDPAVGTLLNLGKCEEERGRVASAWEFYLQALEQLDPNDRRREYAQRKARELEAAIPRLVVRVASEAPSSTVVRLNGTRMHEDLGKPFRLDPGEYALTVDAPQHEQNVYAVFLEAGEIHELTVTPGPRLAGLESERASPDSPADNPAPTAPSPSGVSAPEGTSRTLLWTTAGVGAASLVGGAVLGALSYRDWRRVQERCQLGAEPHGCRPAGLDAQQRGKTMGWLGIALGAVGLVSSGTFAYLVLRPSAGVSVDVTAGMAAPQIQLSGHF